RKGMIYLPGIMFVIIHATLSVKWPMRQTNLYTDWAHFVYNLLAFLLGYVFCLDERFRGIIDRSFKPALVSGMCLAPVIVIMRNDFTSLATPAYTMGYFTYSVVFGLSTWFWILALLGLSGRYLNFNNGFLRYFNRASYPVYIFHLVVMSVIGYYVVEWRTGIILEFFILSVLSFAACIVCYELVKRTRITRFLFGIKG
ncbi:acyltransferase family protein, partial [Candidatus Latescibacterota bacterium]